MRGFSFSIIGQRFKTGQGGNESGNTRRREAPTTFLMRGGVPEREQFYRRPCGIGRKPPALTEKWIVFEFQGA